MQNAIDFITRVDTDTTWRKRCYTCNSRAELQEMLKQEGLGFSDLEAENAFNVLLLKCQTYEQADRVKELQSWYNLFV